MRTCRICLKTDVLNEMIPCFENIDLIEDLYFLSNVAIVELEGDIAKICRRCAKNIKQAASFKRLCIESDTSAKQTSNERFLWFSELQKLKITESIDVAESVVSIRNGIDDETSTITNGEASNEKSELEEIVMEAHDVIAEIENYEKNLNIGQLQQVQNNESRSTSLLDFIEFLNYKQLDELTIGISELLNDNDFLHGNILNNATRDQNTAIST